MSVGISLYLGLGDSLEENTWLIRRAASFGIKRIFTSFLIPETDKERLKDEVGTVLKIARQENLEVIADVSPATLELLGINEFTANTFKMLGISTLRIDAGYDAATIAKLSRNRHNVRIQVNASTMTGNFLTKLISKKTNFQNVDALHNFYPRPGTGLSEETLVRKTVMLHKVGVKVGAFIPGRRKKRAPLFDGLPTLEDHRDMELGLAARHLVALGIDSVFIGDNMPADEEMQELAALKDDCVIVKAKMLTKDTAQQELLEHVFSARTDEARDAIRARESRAMVGAPILPENTAPRKVGAITIDNEKYLRYMGELEIIKFEQEADERVNVAAQVNEEEMFLLDYITPGRKFSFKFQ